MMRKRSSHIPMTTPIEAMTHPVMVRNRRMPIRISGSTKLQITIVQYSGANDSRCVRQNTAISAGSLP